MPKIGRRVHKYDPCGSQILDGGAKALDNDDYVDVVIRSYRHRLGLGPDSPIRLDTLSANRWFRDPRACDRAPLTGGAARHRTAP